MFTFKEGAGVASAQILNKSTQTGDVAQEWRETLMVPLFNKENGNIPCIVQARRRLTSVVCTNGKNC